VALATELELAGRLAASLLLGGAIGLERELTGQVAGLRTHMSIALGAALFGIVSAYGFDAFADMPRAETNYGVDVTRVASNVVTGVGFLGGGAILKEGSSVRGLTTAASIWVTAAVGLAVGVGIYAMAALATLALVLSLTLLRAPRLWLRQRYSVSKGRVVVHMRLHADPGVVIAALRALPDVEVRSVTFRNTRREMVVQADVRGVNLELRLAELTDLDGVIDVSVGG
jgi:putative Mg2+ transporter-C (MgtC) family protein